MWLHALLLGIGALCVAFLVFMVLPPITNYTWYRRLSGGTWYLVTPRREPYIHIWVREPMFCEHVDRVETHPNRIH